MSDSSLLKGSAVLTVDRQYQDGSGAAVADCATAGLDRKPALQLTADGALAIVWGDPALENRLDETAFLAQLAAEPEAALGDLSGAWALAAAFSDGTQLLALDRLGRVPLYVRNTEDRLLAAPDLTALNACDGESAALDPDALYAYVYHHMIPAPFALPRGIRKLRAGEWLQLPATGNGAAEPHWHWKPAFTEPPRFSSTDAGEELRTTLKRAVERCLSGEDKKAAFLSGGLDSSTVVGYLSELTGGDCDAYSIGFDAEGYDEMAYARITAQHFGVRLHEYYVTPDDVLDALPRLAGAFAEPFGNSSALPAYFCARRAAEDGVTVMLAGDGGDELFAGNERYARQGTFQRYLALPRPVRGAINALIDLAPGALPLAGKAKSFLRQVTTPMPHRLFYYSFLEQHDPATVFGSEFLSSADIHAPQAELAATYSRAAGASDLNRMLNLDWQVTLADNDLRKVNGACAHAGVSVRYPMLDDGLLDLSLRIPTREKLQGDNLRAFFKTSLAGWLPDATINKSKQGFGLPFGVWMREYAPLREFAYDTAHDLSLRQVLLPGFVSDTIAQHRSGHASYYGELLWILCALELWLKEHYPEFRFEL